MSMCGAMRINECQRMRVNTRRRAGFSLPEVMFAIIILGIGMMLIAAIFPVAIVQSKATLDETTAATLSRNVAAVVENLNINLPATDLREIGDQPAEHVYIDETSQYHPNNDDYQPTQNSELDKVPMVGRVLSFRDDRLDLAERERLWSAVRGSLIDGRDPRFAAILLFQRSQTLPVFDDALPGKQPMARIWVAIVQSKVRSAYKPEFDLDRWSGGTVLSGDAAHLELPAPLEPQTVYVKTTEGNDRPDQIRFYDSRIGNTAQAEEAAAEGAFVIISDDRRYIQETADEEDEDYDPDLSTSVIEHWGGLNGRVYRLGRKLDDFTWELMPGNDLQYVNPNGIPGDLDDVHENIPARPVDPDGDFDGSGLMTDPPASEPNATAFLIGRGYDPDPENPQGFSDVSQAIAIYDTIVPIKSNKDAK